MQCLPCGHSKTPNHGQTSKGSQSYYYPSCQQTYTETFDTIYYRRQIEPEKNRLDFPIIVSKVSRILPHLWRLSSCDSLISGTSGLFCKPCNIFLFRTEVTTP